MPTNSELNASVCQLEEYLRKSLDESRNEKIAALIDRAKQSTDTVVARIAWAIQTVDEQFDVEIRKIKEQFDIPTPPTGEKPVPSLYPDYTAPVMTIDREMEFTP